MSNPYRLHIRLGKKDVDLILLGSWYRITYMVRHAIQFYLGKTDERLSLPPYNKKVPKEAVYSILFYPERDSEEIAFLQSIPNGYRSAAVKQLLRNAMEKYDIRPLLKNEPKPSKEKKEEPAYREVLTYMKEHNAQAYTGMLDEDFVPHVDAFWYGLERLCTFIDHHVVVTWKKTYTGLSEEECGKLRRAIASRQFAVSESRLEDAFHLQKRFEKKVESLKKAPDNKMTP